MPFDFKIQKSKCTIHLSNYCQVTLLEIRDLLSDLMNSEMTHTVSSDLQKQTDIAVEWTGFRWL